MGTKHDPDGCFQRAKDDEELFTLLARDAFAPILVDLWASLREAAGLDIGDARGVAERMRAWHAKERLLAGFQISEERVIGSLVGGIYPASLPAEFCGVRFRSPFKPGGVQSSIMYTCMLAPGHEGPHGIVFPGPTGEMKFKPVEYSEEEETEDEEPDFSPRTWTDPVRDNLLPSQDWQRSNVDDSEEEEEYEEEPPDLCQSIKPGTMIRCGMDKGHFGDHEAPEVNPWRNRRKGAYGNSLTGKAEEAACGVRKCECSFAYELGKSVMCQLPEGHEGNHSSGSISWPY